MDSGHFAPHVVRDAPDGRLLLEATAISGSYQGRTVDGRPETTIELWCRTRDGPSLLLLIDGMRPYLDVALPGRAERTRDMDPATVEARLARLVADERVTAVAEPVEKWTDLGMKRHWRVEVTQPYLVPRLRTDLERDWEVSSADIPFTNRLFLDQDLGPHLAIEAELLHVAPRLPAEERATWLAHLSHPDDPTLAEGRVRSAGGSGLYPTDLVARCHLDDIRPTEPFDTPWVTLSFDLETSIRHPTIYCAAAITQFGDGRRESRIFSGDERTMMAELTAYVRDRDPDIITGYNIDNFDLPRLQQRQQDHAGGRNEAEEDEAGRLFGWGRVPAGANERRRWLPSRQQSRQWRLTGRLVLDAWWQVRTTLAPKRESLRYVTEMLWPDREEFHKLPIDASRMDEEWANQRELVLEYCERDAHLPLDLLDHMRSVQRKEALAAVAKVPLETAGAGTTSQWIDSLVIRLADRRGVAVPRTRQGRRQDQITGGYVHEVDAGIHRWIAVLDFKSMYPSIMIQENVCYTTRLDPGEGTDIEGVREAPTGVRFLPASEREGLVPTLLRDLMAQRDRLKAALKTARVEGDEGAAAFNDRLQSAVKILMNSFYGVFASAFYRFTHQEIGASITAWARSNIKGVIAQLEAEGHHVVYSDTDSIFVEVPDLESAPLKHPGEDADEEALAPYTAAVEHMREFGQGLARRFSVDGAELEFEQGLSAFFSHGKKKRYVGRVAWPAEDLLIRGYETRRTDAFTLLQEALTTLFDRILDGEDRRGIEEAVELIKQVRRGDMEARRLVTSRSCKGRLQADGTVDFTQDYQNPDAMPWVRAAKLRLERGLSFTPGMKVSWLVVDAGVQPMRVEPWLVDETGEAPTGWDADFYAERLATALGRVTEAFGWTAHDLLRGNRQTSLFSFG